MADETGTTTHEPRGLFERPGMFLATHGVFPLFTVGAMLYQFWLLSGELAGKAFAASLALLLGAAAFWAAGLATGLWMLRKRRAKTSAWVMAGFAFAAVAYLWCVFPAMFRVMDGISDGDLGLQWLYPVFLGLLPAVYAFAGRLLGRVASGRRWWKWTAWAGGGGVAVLTLSISAMWAWDRWGWTRLAGHSALRTWIEQVWFWVFPVLYIAGTIGAVAGLFRLVAWLGRKRSEGPHREAWRIGQTLLFGLALPLGGLALNRKIPFPADFDSPVAWGIAIAAGLALLPPYRRSPAGLFAWAARWAAAPYVLYFFLLFLPFVPLAALSVVIAAAGVLILAPMLLFQFWCEDIADGWRTLRGRYRALPLVALAAAACLAGPVWWATDIEVERAQLKALVAWHAGENFDEPETPPPMGMRRAERIMERVNDYRFGAETPFLTAWRTWRVYGGMHLANPLRQALNRRILGREVNDPRDWRKMERGIFAEEIFSASRARGREGRTRRAEPPKTDIWDVKSVEGDGTGKYAVRLEARWDGDWQAELDLEMQLPAGAWLEGARLKMGDGTWKEARANERKAAEWAYFKVAYQRMLDPLLVTLDSPTHGRMRVFPVTKDLPREVELDVRLPAAGASEWVAAFRAPKSNVFEEDEWMRAEAPEGTGAAALHQIVAAGAEVTWVGPALAEALGTMAEEGTARGGEGWADRIADVRVRLDEGEGEAAAFEADDPDLARKLRRVLRTTWRRLESEGAAAGAPKVSFFRDGAEVPAADAAKRLSAEEKGMMRREFPGLAWLGDRDVDAWFFFPREGGGWVPVPWWRGEPALGFGRAAGVQRIGGAWAEGAKAWALEERAFRHPGEDHRVELLAQTRKCGVLTTQSAYVVLENTIQEKELSLDEKRALAGNKEMEFHETAPEPPQSSAAPEPGTLALLALGAATLAAARCRGRSKK